MIVLMILLPQLRAQCDTTGVNVNVEKVFIAVDSYLETSHGSKCHINMSDGGGLDSKQALVLKS